MLKLNKELDKSKKGSVDEPIVDLVSSINRMHDFCTTSSCSGRFAVFCANYDESRDEQVSVLFFIICEYRKVENGFLWNIVVLNLKSCWMPLLLHYRTVKVLRCLNWSRLCFM